MGHGEDQSLAAFWSALPAADRDERRWLEGPRITSDDLRDGSARVVRCTAGQWFGAAQQRDDRQNYRQSGGQRGAQASISQSRGASRTTGKNGPLMLTFGKHKGRLAADVREEDPGYWAWCMRELGWFAAKARAAGLCEDEEDAA